MKKLLIAMLLASAASSAAAADINDSCKPVAAGIVATSQAPDPEQFRNELELVCNAGATENISPADYQTRLISFDSEIAAQQSPASRSIIEGLKSAYMAGHEIDQNALR